MYSKSRMTLFKNTLLAVVIPLCCFASLPWFLSWHLSLVNSCDVGLQSSVQVRLMARAQSTEPHAAFKRIKLTEVFESIKSSPTLNNTGVFPLIVIM